MSLEQEIARLRAAVRELGKCHRCKGKKQILATRGQTAPVDCSACGGAGMHPVAVAALGEDSAT